MRSGVCVKCLAVVALLVEAGVALAWVGCLTEEAEDVLFCRMIETVGIELGKELFDMFETSDMMLVLLDTAARPSRDL